MFPVWSSLVSQLLHPCGQSDLWAQARGCVSPCFKALPRPPLPAGRSPGRLTWPSEPGPICTCLTHSLVPLLWFLTSRNSGDSRKEPHWLRSGDLCTSSYLGCPSLLLSPDFICSLNLGQVLPPLGSPPWCLLSWARQILHALLYKPRHLPSSHLPTTQTLLTSVPVSLWTVDFRQWEAQWEFCPVDYWNLSSQWGIVRPRKPLVV